jgi:hypothetical protein
MTSKFVITLIDIRVIEQLCLDDIFNTIDKQKLILMSMQQKYKNVALEWCASKWKKNNFLFQKWQKYR